MKIISIKEFCELEGNQLYTIVPSVEKCKNGHCDHTVEGLNLRFDKDDKSWWESSPFNDGVSDLASLNPSSNDGTSFLCGDIPKLPYNTSGVYMHDYLYDDGERVLLMEEPDVIHLIKNLIECFPNETVKALEAEEVQRLIEQSRQSVLANKHR